VPKLWDGTIEAHRREVRKAVIAATTALVAKHGLRAVTMSRIAQDAGIGRATLYKYFSDIESILTDWHDEQVARHLTQLRQLRFSAADPEHRLAKALEALATMSYQADRHGEGAEVAASLHTSDRVTEAERDLHALFLGMIQDAVESGHVREDIPAEELVTYCLNAAMGARHLSSQAAVHRLIQLAMAGLKR
jgi:AcrR family transcriptional regulator